MPALRQLLPHLHAILAGQDANQKSAILDETLTMLAHLKSSVPHIQQKDIAQMLEQVEMDLGSERRRRRENGKGLKNH